MVPSPSPSSHFFVLLFLSSSFLFSGLFVRVSGVSLYFVDLLFVLAVIFPLLTSSRLLLHDCIVLVVLCHCFFTCNPGLGLLQVRRNPPFFALLFFPSSPVPCHDQFAVKILELFFFRAFCRCSFRTCGCDVPFSFFFKPALLSSLCFRPLKRFFPLSPLSKFAFSGPASSPFGSLCRAPSACFPPLSFTIVFWAWWFRSLNSLYTIPHVPLFFVIPFPFRLSSSFPFLVRSVL